MIRRSGNINEKRCVVSYIVLGFSRLRSVDDDVDDGEEKVPLDCESRLGADLPIGCIPASGKVGRSRDHFPRALRSAQAILTVRSLRVVRVLLREFRDLNSVRSILTDKKGTQCCCCPKNYIRASKYVIHV